MMSLRSLSPSVLSVSLCALFTLSLGACSQKSAPTPSTDAPKDTASKPTTPTSAPPKGPASTPSKSPASSPTSKPVETSKAKTMTATTKGGLYKVTLQPQQTPVPFNRIFHISTTVLDAKTSKPVEGAKVAVDATMPAHRHGMVTQPIHTEKGKGVYHSEGMKLHMPGDWVFQVDIDGPAGKDFASIAHKQGSATP